VAVRQRLARLRHGPTGPSARVLTSPSSRTAAAVPALPDATTVAFPNGTAAVSSPGPAAPPQIPSGAAEEMRALPLPPVVSGLAGGASAVPHLSPGTADLADEMPMPAIPLPRAAARSQPAPRRVAAARPHEASAGELAVDGVPPPSGLGAHPWDLPPSRDRGGSLGARGPTEAGPSMGLAAVSPAGSSPRAPSWERVDRGVDDTSHWQRTSDEPDDRPSRFGGASPFDPGRRGVKALAVVALVVVLVAAVIAWRARPRPQPVGAVAEASAEPGSGSAVGGGAAGPGAGTAGQDGTAASGDPASGSGVSASAGEVVVAVAGKVRRPGLVRLPAGARVADALEAAGGALPGTDVALLNLARKVTDGELILVGVTAPPAPSGGAGPTQSGGKVNLNTATLAELDALPGVGPVLAQRILDHRDQHGGFRSVGDLRQVDGIGDARYEQLKELVTV
jgi:competence protein ComEA